MKVGCSRAGAPHQDLFGAGARSLLARLQLDEPSASTVKASIELIDQLDEQIADCEKQICRLGADHRDVPLLTIPPGVACSTLAFSAAKGGLDLLGGCVQRGYEVVPSDFAKPERRPADPDRAGEGAVVAAYWNGHRAKTVLELVHELGPAVAADAHELGA